MTSIPPDPQFDVIIAGAGPVGSLLACLLGEKKLRVLVLEKRTETPAHSMAIGITPPSLRILEKLRLAGKFADLGVKVRDCFVHGQSGYLGCVSFREIPGDHPYILSLPQSATVSLLHRKLEEYPSVTLRTGVEVTDARQYGSRAVATFVPDEGASSQTATAHCIVACDGSRSRIRDLAGLSGRGADYLCHFVMGDFIDDGSLRDEAHLFFTATGSVESFPLPQGKRRWIVQTDGRVDDAPEGFISSIVLQRTGIALLPGEQLNQSSFTPRRFNCDRYHSGRIVLCGDAAHGMSPVGGQGMNTGFADAEFLAWALDQMLLGNEAPEPLLKAYSRYRRRSAASAIRRAHWSMWLGTWRGRAASVVRDFIIRHLLCRGPLARRMGSLYAMLNIPYNSLDRVPVTRLIPAEA